MFNSISTQSHNDPNTSSGIHNFPPYHSAAIYDCNSLHHRHNINNVIELQPQTILNPSSSEHQGNLITSSTTIQTKEEKCSNFFPDSGNNGSKRAKRDRHTKISTAHGVRDRRVRLSMGIAREFFDLQDMLGFDKASMTLAWLLAHSRHAIQEVAAVKASRYCPVVPTTAGSSTPCIKDHKSLKEMPRESTSAACIITSCSSARQAVRAGGARSSSVVVKEKRAKARERARERVREKLYSKLGQQQQQRGVAGMAYRPNATAPSLQHHPALSLSSSAGANNGRSGTQELEIKRQGHVDVPTQLCTRGFNEYTAPYHHHRSSLQSFCVPFHQDRTVQDQLMSARGTFNFPDLSLGTNEADVGIKRQDVDIPPTQGYTTGFNGSTNNAAVKPYHLHHHRTPVLQNCCVSLFQDVGSDQMAAARSGTFNFPSGLYLGSNDAQMNSSFSALDFDAARL